MVLEAIMRTEFEVKDPKKDLLMLYAALMEYDDEVLDMQLHKDHIKRVYKDHVVITTKYNDEAHYFDYLYKKD